MKKWAAILGMVTIITGSAAAAPAGVPAPDSSLPKAEARHPQLQFRHILQPAAWLKAGLPVHTALGLTREGRAVEAYYFPGTSDQTALVIGGVHGSELSALEVVAEVRRVLSEGGRPYYNVIVLPCLFPDNAAHAAGCPEAIGSTRNLGRYTDSTAADPNRQMPPLGQAFNPAHPVDARGRCIEGENQLLLRLIEAYRPQRIVNVHAIRDRRGAGFFADPRTDCNGTALGFTPDSALAVRMARSVQEKGGYVPGNRLSTGPTALYPADPFPVPAGQLQPRNAEGSRLPGGRGCGISLGSWATTAVCRGGERPAAQLITVEFPGNKRPMDYALPQEQAENRRQVQWYAEAILNVFLGTPGPNE
ncbi:MAG TPA: hypothetical protein VHK69_06785 [Chitinophagaceae bacterium]|jgi:hypothetical protein|nr:hypothetical protein [Chitinophagaceae bacterium]